MTPSVRRLARGACHPGALVILLSCGLAPRAAATPDPAPAALPSILRLDDALQLLGERGLDLLIAEALVSSAEGDVRVAGAVANPGLSLSYGRSFTYGNCTDPQGNPVSCGVLPDAQYGIGLSDSGALLDAISGKRGLRQRSARAALEAARASRDDALRALRGQVKQAFAQAVVAKEALRFAHDVAAASARTAELTRERYQAGAISEADLSRIEIAKLESDQAADTAAQGLRDAKTALAFLLGVRDALPEFDVEGPELLRARAPRSLENATAESLLGRARDRRPDLAAALQQRQRAEAALELARRQRFPDVAVSLNYTQQGTTSTAVTPPTLTAGLSFPLPVFYHQSGEIQKAEAELRTQELQARKVEAQVLSDVAGAFSAYSTSSRLTGRMQSVLLERARRSRDLVSVQYEKGAASLLDFLDAQRTFIATSVEYLQDVALFWTAVFRLEQAVGGEL